MRKIFACIKKILKKYLGSFLVISLVGITIFLLMSNIKNNVDFLKTPITNIISIYMAITISYYLVQNKTESRRSSDKVDKFLIDIHICIEKLNDLIMKGDETSSLVLISERNINSRIATLIDFDHCKKIINELKYVKNHSEEYFNIYHDKYNILKSEDLKIQMNSLACLIEKKLDEMQILLLK